MALLVLRILIILVPLVLLVIFLRKKGQGSGWTLTDLLPIALGILATVILLIFAIKLTEPEELPPTGGQMVQEDRSS